MKIKPVLSILCLALTWDAAAAESFVKNEQERARIEAALPPQAPERPAKARRLLIFTLNVNYGGHPSMAHANEAFTLMGQRTGAFETVVSNDPSVFERGSLNQFDAVFFNNTVGNCFTNADLRRNLIEFIVGGGGLMGVHGTSVGFTKWPGAIEDWPEFGYAIGARGANHKDSDEHIWMKLDDAESPILSVFGGQPFDFRDEFFRPQGTYTRERVRVLLSIDTAKSDPDKGQARGDCFRADGDYAVAWIRSYGRGRVFYCTIAHNPYVFWDPKMLRFYLAAAQFALGDLPCGTIPSAKLSPAVKAQEQLGWRVSLDAGGPGAPNFALAARTAARLRLAYVTGSDAQLAGAEMPKPLAPRSLDSGLDDVRLMLEAATVRCPVYRYRGRLDNEAAVEQLFAFGRKLGIELFVLDQRSTLVPAIRRLAEASNTRVAFQARTRADAVALGRLAAEQGRFLGVALNLSDPAFARSEPGRALGAIRDRLFYLCLPKEPRQWERVERWLKQAHAMGAKPFFAVAGDSAPAVIDQFNTTVLSLAAQQN